MMIGYWKDIAEVAGAELPWEQLQGGNILVTGATGLLGSCLIDVLMHRVDADYHVYAAGRNEARAQKLFQKYQTDARFHFLKYNVMCPLQSNLSFQYIIHAASNASPSFFADNPVEVMKANVVGIINLLEYGREHELRRLMYVSTGEVYGEGDGRVFTEEYSGYVDPMKSRSCYPSSKRAAETFCAAYVAEYGMDVVVARPSHTYGPHFTEADNRVYAQFIRNVLNGENIVLKSKGEQCRSWLYVVDCVSALLTILCKGECGQAYNVADEQSEISIRQLAELIAAQAGVEVLFDIPQTQDKGNTTPITVARFATNKLRALGWQPLFSMADGLSHTIATMR